MWPFAKPAGEPLKKAPGMGQGPSPVYEYSREWYPTPGTGNYAFPGTGYIPQQFAASQFWNRQQLRPLQSPQMFAPQKAYTNLLGASAYIAGQVVLQPLSTHEGGN